MGAVRWKLVLNHSLIHKLATITSLGSLGAVSAGIGLTKEPAAHSQRKCAMAVLPPACLSQLVPAQEVLGWW